MSATTKKFEDRKHGVFVVYKKSLGRAQSVYAYQELMQVLGERLVDWLFHQRHPAVVNISDLKVEENYAGNPDMVRISYDVVITPVEYQHVTITKANADFGWVEYKSVKTRIKEFGRKVQRWIRSLGSS